MRIGGQNPFTRVISFLEALISLLFELIESEHFLFVPPIEAHLAQKLLVRCSDKDDICNESPIAVETGERCSYPMANPLES